MSTDIYIPSLLDLIKSNSNYKTGDIVWVNGRKRTIDQYDPATDLYKLDGGTWVHESSFNQSTTASPWAQSIQSLEPPSVSAGQQLSFEVRCECGSEITYGPGYPHSSWCPKASRS